MAMCRFEVHAKDIREGDIIIADRGRRLTVTEVERILDTTPCEGSEPFGRTGCHVVGVGITAMESAVNHMGKTVTREIYRERRLGDIITIERG